MRSFWATCNSFTNTNARTHREKERETKAQTHAFSFLLNLSVSVDHCISCHFRLAFCAFWHNGFSAIIHARTLEQHKGTCRNDGVGARCWCSNRATKWTKDTKRVERKIQKRVEIEGIPWHIAIIDTPTGIMCHMMWLCIQHLKGRIYWKSDEMREKWPNSKNWILFTEKRHSSRHSIRRIKSKLLALSYKTKWENGESVENLAYSIRLPMLHVLGK